MWHANFHCHLYKGKTTKIELFIIASSGIFSGGVIWIITCIAAALVYFPFLILCVRYKYIFSWVVHVMPFSASVIVMTGIRLEWITFIIIEMARVMVMKWKSFLTVNVSKVIFTQWWWRPTYIKRMGILKCGVSTYLLTGVGARDAYASKKNIYTNI